MPIDLLPIYDSTIVYSAGHNIQNDWTKIDQFHYYLSEFDSYSVGRIAGYNGSAVLTKSFWDSHYAGYSLFNFTTIVYRGSDGKKIYYIDPATYKANEKPVYYSNPFPLLTAYHSSLDFYSDT